MDTQIRALHSDAKFVAGRTCGATPPSKLYLDAMHCSSAPFDGGLRHDCIFVYDPVARTRWRRSAAMRARRPATLCQAVIEFMIDRRWGGVRDAPSSTATRCGPSPHFSRGCRTAQRRGRRSPRSTTSAEHAFSCSISGRYVRDHRRRCRRKNRRYPYDPSRASKPPAAGRKRQPRSLPEPGLRG